MGKSEAAFFQREIDEALFQAMYGKSYGRDCTLPRGELRYLQVLHYDLEGQVKKGEMVCNQSISRTLLEIFQALFESRYPIEKMVLIDVYGGDDLLSMADNNSSCFNFRCVAGTRRLSNHSRGLAVDINPRYNPYVIEREGGLCISPVNGGVYAERSDDFPYKIDHQDLCYKEFIKHGFTWGGDWNHCKDYQHFEKI